MPFSKEFLKDPKGFADLYPLLPGLSRQDPSELKAKPVDANYTLYQVKGANKILFACIEKNQRETNLFEVELSTGQPTNDWFPVYWLPWEQNQAYRITLKPSKKLSIIDREERVVSPNIFFTASLSGCLVHVDGDPSAPTVYHLNAKSYQPTKAPPSHTQLEWDYFEKVIYMEQQAEAARLRYPKGKPHHQPGSANAFQYSPFSTNDKTLDAQRALAARALETPFADVLPVNIGVVFGVRSEISDLWVFYYQSLTRYVYSKNNQSFKEWVVHRCERFWPGRD